LVAERFVEVAFDAVTPPVKCAVDDALRAPERKSWD